MTLMRNVDYSQDVLVTEESDLDSKEIRETVTTTTLCWCHTHPAQLAPAGWCPLLLHALRAKEKQFPAAALPRCHGGVCSAPPAPQPRSWPHRCRCLGHSTPCSHPCRACFQTSLGLLFFLCNLVFPVELFSPSVLSSSLSPPVTMQPLALLVNVLVTEGEQGTRRAITSLVWNVAILLSSQGFTLVAHGSSLCLIHTQSN